MSTNKPSICSGALEIVPRILRKFGQIENFLILKILRKFGQIENFSNIKTTWPVCEVLREILMVQMNEEDKNLILLDGCYVRGSDRNKTGWEYDAPFVSDFRKGFASKLR